MATKKKPVKGAETNDAVIDAVIPAGYENESGAEETSEETPAGYE